MLSPGQRVQLHEIQSQPQLNGLQGTLVVFDDEKGRWKVQLDGGELKSLKPGNLKPTEATPQSATQNTAVAQSRTAENQISTVLINAGVGVVKRNPIKMLLWLVGLLLLQFATGFAVSESAAADYQAAMNKMEDTSDLQQQVAIRYRAYQEKTFLFSCTGECIVRKTKYEEKKKELDAANGRNELIVRDAKSKVGIMSEYGVSEARDLFWNQFSHGQKFAKRSSWYDLFFMGMGSMVMGRDESIVEFALRFLIQMLFNFTLGLCGALVGFYWYLWGLVTSYGASSLTGIAFFALAVIAGTSLVSTYLFALYGAAAGTVYVAAKAAHNARIEGMPISD